MTATVIRPLNNSPEPTGPTGPTEPEKNPAARVRLKPDSDRPGMVNGAWWPRSRDLVRELPPLIAVLDERWGRIIRVTVNVRMWPDIPKRVRTGEHVVHVGWFDAEQDPHDICLLSYNLGGRWDLVVVPPETDAAAAERLMATASDVHNKQTASALVESLSTPLSERSGDAARVREWAPMNELKRAA